MRWRFIDENNELESAYKLKMLQKIDEFWKSFAKDIDIIITPGQATSWVTSELPKISPELMWELSPKIDGIRRFVITPESNYGLYPLVDSMLQRAPQLQEFRFMTQREPIEPERISDLVQGRTGRWYDDVKFSAELGRHNAIDLRFFSARFNGQNARSGF